ncbi:MAG TPA: alpha/beta fold hydrolase [Clostridia bacterium]
MVVTAAIILISAFAGYLAIHFYYAYKTLHPKILANNKTPQDYGMQYSEHHVITDDKYKILVWVINNIKQEGVIVLSHNLGANMSKMLPYAKFLFDSGYSVVLFDYRNHGESDRYKLFWGVFKVLEKDLEEVICLIRKLYDMKEVPIGLMGFSMGTIPVIPLAANISEVKAVILDCGPFISIKSIFKSTFKRMNISFKWAVPWLYIWFIRLMLGRSTKFIKKAVGQISPKPILFIHGEKDSIIPCECTKLLFDEHAKEPKDYWLVPSSHHLTAYVLYPAEYSGKVLEFFGKYIKLNSEQYAKDL